MKDDALNLLREVVISVQSASKTLNIYPQLRITCASGAKFEAHASITDVQSKLEIFEIEIKSVAEFSELQQWPGGPAVEWNEVEEISNVLRASEIEAISAHYSDQGFLEGEPVPGMSELKFRLNSGESFVLSHLNRPGFIETGFSH